MQRAGRLSPLSEVLEELLARREARVRAKERLAALVWREAVGFFYGERTEVTHVERGVVHVWCNSPALAHQLTLDSAEVIRRLNTILGGEYVRELRAATTRKREREDVGEVGIAQLPAPNSGELERVELTPQEIARIESEAARIPDEGLRERFRAVALAQRRGQKWRLEHGYNLCQRCGWLSPPSCDHCTKCGSPV